MRRLDMGSIGFAALGRTILKNNRAQRPESKRGISLVSKTQSYTDPKNASPELLKTIRTRMSKDRKRRHQKIVITTSIIFTVVILCILYIISNI